MKKKKKKKKIPVITMPVSFYNEMLLFFERVQKNIDLLRRDILENATSGYQIKEHFFLLAKMVRKATESVVLS